VAQGDLCVAFRYVALGPGSGIAEPLGARLDPARDPPSDLQWSGPAMPLDSMLHDPL
jgi:hypothetical protein